MGSQDNAPKIGGQYNIVQRRVSASAPNHAVRIGGAASAWAYSPQYGASDATLDLTVSSP